MGRETPACNLLFALDFSGSLIRAKYQVPITIAVGGDNPLWLMAKG
jgi:hypothetical protein